MSDQDIWRKVMFSVHNGLPREAPGSGESTRAALALINSLPEAPRVLDVGCGPGMQTLDLANALPQAVIDAVDLHPPFIEEGARRAAAAGCSDRVRFQVADMRNLPFDEASFDLIWSEGAAYIMGVPEALAAWHQRLEPGGAIGFTDAVWLTDRPPQTLAEWWKAGYPDIGDVNRLLDRVANAGFDVLGHFMLPESAWWNDYYKPMEARIAGLRVEFEGDATLLEELEEHQREIDYYRRWAEHYGYLFVVGCKAA